jgi:transcriptional regulator GlxA family with amidase domain
VRELLAFIEEHPEAPLTVTALADKIGMSVRNFTRVFGAEVGVTPAAFVERVRVEAARRLLESTERSVADVASACGFAGADAFRRAFGRCVGLSPSEYRARFGTAHTPPMERQH